MGGPQTGSPKFKLLTTYARHMKYSVQINVKKSSPQAGSFKIQNF